MSSPTSSEQRELRRYLTPQERAEMDRLLQRATPGLMEFIPEISPRYMAPLHLMPLVRTLETAIDRAQVGTLTEQAVCSVPPRHSKTETILHGVAWGLRKRPELTFGYISYSNSIAYSKSRKAQALAKRAGVRLTTTNVAEWRTAEGGGLLATGIGGQLTGHGLDVAIVDDPTKNRLEAESSTYRNRTWDWFSDVLSTRVEPGGTIIVNATRWHPDDLIGRLLREEGERWRSIHLPAISDDGKALWPERWPLALLNQRRARVGEYAWASLFQGRPRPRGGALFGEPRSYSKLPRNGVLIAIGLDFAYSKRTASDWSVAIVMLLHEGKVYLVDVMRQQVKAPEFKQSIHGLWLRHGKPALRWYGYGPELGVADFLRDGDHGMPLQILQAPGDHFIRAQPFAAAWNRGDVLVPEEAPWLDDYLAELCSFTGVNDDHDDQVDASGAAFDILAPYLGDRTVERPEPGTPAWIAEQERELEEAARARVNERRRMMDELTGWDSEW